MAIIYFGIGKNMIEFKKPAAHSGLAQWLQTFVVENPPDFQLRFS